LPPIRRPLGAIQRPPILRCTDCSFVIQARRRLETERLPIIQVRARIWQLFEFDAERCPNDGTKLVGECACGVLITTADDERCRVCGRPYPWATTSERQKQVEHWSKSSKHVGAVNSVDLYAVRGTIVYTSADALISFDNEDGEMASTSARALRERGGSDIEEESMSVARQLGTAWMTFPGRLPVSHVLHLGLLDEDGNTTTDLARDAVCDAVQLARGEGLRTLAMPPIGIDRGLDIHRSVAATVEGICSAGDGPAIQVAMVVLGDQEFGDFRDALKAHLGSLGRN
jgi:O-acetyl-ADP-ribose deacetylase (regulator of RNase III)